MTTGTRRNQYLVGICVNIITVSHGGFCGWSSASFLELESDETPLTTGPLSSSESGWISASLCFGGLTGTIFFASIVNKWGRKLSLMIIAVPLLLGWLIIPFARTPTHFCISRFMGGLGGGGALEVIPLYITEIADNKARGVLGTYLFGSSNLGLLAAFILGYYFSYTTVAWIMLVPVLIFAICFIFLPETPVYLMSQNKIEEAEKAYRYLKDLPKNIAELPEEFRLELKKLKGDDKLELGTGKNDSKITWADITHPKAVKAILIGIGLMSINQFSGLFALMNYTASVFEISGSNLSPKISAIIVGAIQFFSSYMASLFVQHWGRKTLLCVSAIGTSIGLSTLGFYIYLSLLGYQLASFSWVPLAAFSLTIVMACLGILPLPFVVIAEIAPPKIRNIACMTSLILLWTFASAMLKLFPILLEWIGLHNLLFVCAGYCLGGVFFIIIFLPETKGKSIDAILEML